MSVAAAVTTVVLLIVSGRTLEGRTLQVDPVVTRVTLNPHNTSCRSTTPAVWWICKPAFYAVFSRISLNCCWHTHTEPYIINNCPTDEEKNLLHVKHFQAFKQSYICSLYNVATRCLLFSFSSRRSNCTFSNNSLTNKICCYVPLSTLTRCSELLSLDGWPKSWSTGWDCVTGSACVAANISRHCTFTFKTI